MYPKEIRDELIKQQLMIYIPKRAKWYSFTIYKNMATVYWETEDTFHMRDDIPLNFVKLAYYRTHNYILKWIILTIASHSQSKIKLNNFLANWWWK